MRSGITAAGSFIVDRVKTVDRWPEQDTLANILTESIGNGGGAFNVLVDLARLGFPHQLRAMGCVGDDPDGNWIRNRCQELDIDAKGLVTVSESTSYTDVITVQSSGRRTFFHRRGANASFGRDPFDIGQISSRILYLGYLLLLDSLDDSDRDFGTKAARLLHDARSLGIRTAVDVVSEDGDRFRAIVRPALPHVDWLFLNEFEAEKTTGIEIRGADGLSVEAARTAAGALLELGVCGSVFLHAPEGALAASREGESLWVPSPPLERRAIAGAVGAGDAFAAGALFRLHEGAPLAQCVEGGMAAAAASLRHVSASDGIVLMSECLELMLQGKSD